MKNSTREEYDFVIILECWDRLVGHLVIVSGVWNEVVCCRYGDKIVNDLVQKSVVYAPQFKDTLI